jgi:hypothetical protein
MKNKYETECKFTAFERGVSKHEFPSRITFNVPFEWLNSQSLVLEKKYKLILMEME